MLELKTLLVDDESIYRNEDPLVMSGFLRKELHFPQSYQEAEESIRSRAYDYILLDHDLSRFRDSYGRNGKNLWWYAVHNSPNSFLKSISGMGDSKGYVYDFLTDLTEDKDKLLAKFSNEKTEEVIRRIRKLQSLEKRVIDKLPNKRYIPLSDSAEGYLYSIIPKLFEVSDEDRLKALVKIGVAQLGDNELEDLYDGRLHEVDFVDVLIEKYRNDLY